MTPGDRHAPDAALDRHALVLALWVAAGFVALACFHRGLGAGSIAALVCAFASILAAFVGHVIVNAVTDTTFSARELGLGLVLYLAALLAFGLAILGNPAPWVSRHWITLGGFIGLAAVAVFYLVIARGARGAFEGFDVIRSFRAERQGRDRSSR